jgi:hypothetical protein
MPKTPCVEMSPAEHAQMRAALRRARYGSRLSRHLLLVCGGGRHPTAMADGLCGARSSVYRPVRASRAGLLGLKPAAAGRLSPPLHTTGLGPSLRRALVARLQAPPRAYGWCRTRGRCATLARTWPTTRGLTGAAETRRRWGHAVGWVWTRAPLVAQDDAPPRVTRRARLRDVFAPLTCVEARVFADARDLPVGPTGGGAWMPNGPQRAVMTPGPHQPHDRAGALDRRTGTVPHCRGPRNTPARCRDRRPRRAARYPAARSMRREVVADHAKRPQAKAVEPWLAAHPRVTRRVWPPSGPRANPMARAVGDVHDGCTRTPQRKRFPALVAEVEDQGPLNGPGKDQRSALDHEPAVTAAVEKMAQEEHATTAA